MPSKAFVNFIPPNANTKLKCGEYRNYLALLHGLLDHAVPQLHVVLAPARSHEMMPGQLLQQLLGHVVTGVGEGQKSNKKQSNLHSKMGEKA
jgi:hypothetical protein